MERRIALSLNRKRMARDISKLRLDKQISRVSRFHTKEMIDDDDLAHTPLTTLAGRITNWIELGENIGRSNHGARAIIKAMMNSPLHRANILNATFNHVGVGSQRASGYLWVTVTFEAREDPGTTLRMPRC